eukprot:TRINITY_DN4551_c0_g1_i1.p1 TRINITY_DN4551_c0_g1~~TRINITY_DN4551_c0_g1_i1.p1  ORF type:complete len:197 (+),score=41.18 TRINITY_DN4551_c0_g1_i1:514-1104(+)
MALNRIMVQNGKEKVNQIVAVHRFAGKTIFKMGDKQLGLRIETVYEGAYGQAYYVVIDYDKCEKSIFIAKHTLPYFIPLARISQKFLNSNFRIFANVVSDYLNAFVSRQQQLYRLQSHVEGIETSESYDYITFKLTRQNRIYEFKVIYDDLVATVPSRTSILVGGKRCRRMERVMRENPLDKGFSILFPQLRFFSP